MESGEGKEKGTNIDGLSDKQKKQFLHYLSLWELDIEEEVEEGIVEEDEAENDLAQIKRIEEKLLGASSTAEE